jgi:hypothetical protein
MFPINHGRDRLLWIGFGNQDDAILWPDSVQRLGRWPCFRASHAGADVVIA